MTDNWNDAATSALQGMWDLAKRIAETDGEDFDLGDWTVEELREHFDDFIDCNLDDGHWEIEGWWRSVGMDAMLLSANRGFPLSVGSVQEVLVRKQRDYGHENIRRFGLQGLIVRTHDKVARLENLLASGGTPNNESIEDTLLDIVGYSAIGIMWARGDFLLELKPI